MNSQASNRIGNIDVRYLLCVKLFKSREIFQKKNFRSFKRRKSYEKFEQMKLSNVDSIGT